MDGFWFPRSTRDPNAPRSLFKSGQAVCQWAPGVAAIGGLVESAARSLPRAIFPRSLSRRPKVRVDDFRIAWIESECDGAGVLVLIENLLPVFTAVGRTKHSAFFVWPVRMPERCDVHQIRIARIDEYRSDLLHVPKAEMLPRFSAVS